MSKCAGSVLMLDISVRYRVSLCNEFFLLYILWKKILLWLFLGLRNRFLLCKQVHKVDQEGEFPPTGPEVRHLKSLLDKRTNCNSLFWVLYFQFDSHFLCLYRRISGFRIREGAFPPTVLSVYMGKWNLSPSPSAYAQHWGAASVSGPHSEDGGNQVRASDNMGGLCKPFNIYW